MQMSQPSPTSPEQKKITSIPEKLGAQETKQDELVFIFTVEKEISSIDDELRAYNTKTALLARERTKEDRDESLVAKLKSDIKIKAESVEDLNENRRLLIELLDNYKSIKKREEGTYGDRHANDVLIITYIDKALKTGAHPKTRLELLKLKLDIENRTRFAGLNKK